MHIITWQGVHTYTGRGDDGIGFTGAMVSTFTPFVIKHGVRPLRGDGRHRDMSRKEARKILIEESSKFKCTSPSLPPP